MRPDEDLHDFESEFEKLIAENARLLGEIKLLEEENKRHLETYWEQKTDTAKLRNRLINREDEKLVIVAENAKLKRMLLSFIKQTKYMLEHKLNEQYLEVSLKPYSEFMIWYEDNKC